jgi:hypothetical protein
MRLARHIAPGRRGSRQAASAGAVTVGATGLIMLLHINATTGQAARCSSRRRHRGTCQVIGEMQVQFVVTCGGSSLLVETFNQLTGADRPLRGDHPQSLFPKAAS